MNYFTRLLGALLLLLSSAAFANPLLDSSQLQALLNEPQIRVLDIRAPDAYAAGHIPNAISAPYARWRGPANNPGQLPDTEALERLVQELGLSPEQHIVVYSTGDDETDFGASARVYWTLKYLGFDNLSLLNGGYRYWKAENGDISLAAVSPQASQTGVSIQPNLVIFKDELLEKITHKQGNYQLLDSRPPAFFQGKVKAPTASTGGTIAGAQNAPFQQWFIPGDTRVRSAEEIRRLVREQGLDKADETLSFCNTGHWAATNWFVLSELAGLPHVRLYPASMAEWTQSAEALPMDNTPSRLEQIKNKFQQLVN